MVPDTFFSLILSAPEDDPDAPVTARRVEEVFQRVARVVDLCVGGKTIRTTHEHPFYVVGKGWKQAAALLAGDLLRSHDGKTLPVESVTDTNDDVTVYNMRIEEYHTYFVGSAEWGFSVWAHNATYRGALRNAMGEPPTPVSQAHHDLPWKFRDWFGNRGYNVNNPAYGRWVGPGHQGWSKAFNDLWGAFINQRPPPTEAEIDAFLKAISANPRFQ